MDPLIKMRAIIKGKLTRFKNHVKEIKATFETSPEITVIPNAQIFELQSRCDNARAFLSEYENIHTEIMKVTKEDNLAEQDYAEFESVYFSTIAETDNLLKKLTVNSRSASPNGSEHSATSRSKSSLNYQKGTNFKLPKITIPNFNGQIGNWSEYKNVFCSLIHDNSDLSDIQKLHYLKGSLIGPAAEIIKNLEFTAANYQIAYQALISRYDQPKLLIRNHFKSILDLEPLAKESASNLRKIIDILFKHVTALLSLTNYEQLFESFIVHIVSGKLDATTSRQWEVFRNKSRSDFPNLSEFKSFLNDQANLLESLETKSIKTSKVTSERPQFQAKSFVSGGPSCLLCKKDHYLYQCENFNQMNPGDRSSKAKELRACLNCLCKGHIVSQCHSKFRCKVCKSKHHSLLHTNSAAPAQTPPSNEMTSTSQGIVGSSSISAFCSHAVKVLLPTATCKVFDSRGNSHSIRVLLDSGSQSNFVRSDLCNQLDIPVKGLNTTVTGLSGALSHIRSSCQLELFAHHTPYKIQVCCLVLDEITGALPSFQINNSNLKIPENIILSDPLFDRPGKIDLLIGSSIFFELLCIGQIKLGPSLPILQKTRFGWVVSGPIGANQDTHMQCHFSRSDVHVPDQLSRFWELESYPTKRELSTEEKFCENHFVQNTRRDPEGRFVVSIPLKQSVEVLGDSFSVAQKRLFSLERRLQSDPDLSVLYSAFMKEYVDLGHMSLSDSNPNQMSYYLPHHGVLKEVSLTTKLRVVFNGSQATTTGASLNSIQMVGPTIQEDLFSILIRFRKNAYIIASDIEKMYRQVQIDPSQRTLQRILWRFSPSDQVQSYDLNTVTYGTASASFLAIRSLYQLGIECETSDPKISEIIKRDFYVDDLLTGASSIEEAREVCSKLSAILSSGCFNLRKWISNDPSVLFDLPDSELHPGILQLGSHEHTNTLGLIWSFSTDQLMYSIPIATIPTEKMVTKRIMLSEVSQIFDPLGLLSPCTIIAKAMLQALWLEKLSWDDPVPINILSKWTSFRNELGSLNSLEIERHAVCSNPTEVQLHGFSDASLQGYGACIYLRSVDINNQVQVHLLCAKSRVAPLKPMTVPKLELCGALVLAKLTDQVIKAISMPISNIFLWSDSTIVLGWLKTTPNLLKTFVCNRVADIQDLVPKATWQHVPTNSNPADLLSRGTTPQMLRSSDLWWYGPTWLAEAPSLWPSYISVTSELPELKNPVQCLLVVESTFPFHRFSNLLRLQRVVICCLRFARNCLSPKADRITGPISPSEYEKSLLVLYKIAQSEILSEEIKQLSRGSPLKSNSNLLSLNPFIDSEGIIRVGGRLINSQFSYEKKHPVLLTGKHPLSKLLVEREHKNLLHAGPQLTLASLRDRVWITSGRNLTKKVAHNCIQCFKCAPKPLEPIMGNLPSARVDPTPPFHVVGVDFAGPMHIKDRKGRGCKIAKSYVCLYVCFSTKAVHVELVTDLSTESFLLSFRRFVARRGKPLHVYSDNGTNFVGARSELRELGQFLKDQVNSIPEAVAIEGTTWHFIPSRSPHFGGLWEAGIKSLKYHLRRVIGNCILTYEEMYTLLTQVESTLNSRPISPLSSDPNDLQPLTPAHFLVGRPLTALPDPNVTDIKDNRLSVFQKIQQIHQHLWKRWSREYISTLQQRQRWKTHHSDLQLGMLVLIKEDNMPPLRWKLGRVIQIHPGTDNISRVASLKTPNGTIRRSFNKLCPLPVDFSV